jgi:hypothetical protein
MKKLIHASFLLLAAFLFLSPATASAQQPGLPPLPPPELQNSPPPELDALPPPSPLEWQPLGPKGAEDLSTGGEVTDVPPPKDEPSDVPPPPPPIIETPLPGGPDPSEVELVKPEVEVWRGTSEWPQIPERRSNRLDEAYVTGTEPVWLRAQFNPLAAGKRVLVRPGQGVTLLPPATGLTVSSTGECLVLAQLDEGIERSHITFYCAGAKTVLPVVRASLVTVIAAEEETGGGR